MLLTLFYSILKPQSSALSSIISCSPTQTPQPGTLSSRIVHEPHSSDVIYQTFWEWIIPMKRHIHKRAICWDIVHKFRVVFCLCLDCLRRHKLIQTIRSSEGPTFMDCILLRIQSELPCNVPGTHTHSPHSTCSYIFKFVFLNSDQTVLESFWECSRLHTLHCTAYTWAGWDSLFC